MESLCTYWFDEPEDRLPHALFSHVESIENDQSELHRRNLYHSVLYSGRDELGLNWSGRSGGQEYGRSISNNVIKQCIDTAASIIAKNKPKIRVMTDDADWSDQRKARDFEKFIWGEFNRLKVYEIGPDIFRDAGVFGDGGVKIYEAHGKVCLERVLIDEIIVDERDCCATGVPRELHQRKLYEKDVLKSLFPEYEAEIDKADKKKSAWADTREIPSNHCVVLETWRLPAGPEQPGIHIIAVDCCVLFQESYTKDHFPFAFFKWSKPLTGFYGQGIAEELLDLQVRLNKLERFVARCQDLIAVPRVFVEGTGPLSAQLDDTIGAVIRTRSKPVFFTAQALGPEIYEERERLTRQAFERIGISQLSAQSLKPAGLESAVALRQFNEIEGQRFAIVAQRYEQWFKDVANLVIECAAELYRGKSSAKTTWASESSIEIIDWADVDMEADRFVLTIEAASILTMSPAARLQAVTELAQVGQLEKQEIRYLLNHPDLERSDSDSFADFENCLKTIQMLEEVEHEYMPPEPFQNLDLCLKRIQLRYLALKNRPWKTPPPEEVFERFRDWISQAKDLMEIAAGEGVPEEAMGGPAVGESGPVPEAPLGGGPMAAAIGNANASGLPIPLTV